MDRICGLVGDNDKLVTNKSTLTFSVVACLCAGNVLTTSKRSTKKKEKKNPNTKTPLPIPTECYDQMG